MLMDCSMRGSTPMSRSWAAIPLTLTLRSETSPIPPIVVLTTWQIPISLVPQVMLVAQPRASLLLVLFLPWPPPPRVVVMESLLMTASWLPLKASSAYFDRLKGADGKDPSSQSKDADISPDDNPIIAATNRTTIEQNAIYEDSKVLTLVSLLMTTTCGMPASWKQLPNPHSPLARKSAKTQPTWKEIMKSSKSPTTKDSKVATTVSSNRKSSSTTSRRRCNANSSNSKATLQRLDLASVNTWPTPQAASHLRFPLLAWVDPHAASPTQPSSTRTSLKNASTESTNKRPSWMTSHITSTPNPTLLPKKQNPI